MIDSLLAVLFMLIVWAAGYAMGQKDAEVKRQLNDSMRRK